jgi:hypothetical protein
MIGGYDAMAVRAVVTTSHGPVSFTSVHLETVREGLEAVGPDMGSDHRPMITTPERAAD